MKLAYSLPETWGVFLCGYVVLCGASCFVKHLVIPLNASQPTKSKFYSYIYNYKKCP